MRKKACFACTTPFQLIGAIAIAQRLRLETDLYLYGMFDGYKDVAKRLNMLCIFDKVIAIECERYLNISKFRALWQSFNSRNEVKRYLSSDVDYEFYYSSSRAHPKLLLYYELRRRNPDIQYIIYDDGIGSYTSYSPLLNKTKIRYLIEWLIRRNVFEPKRTSVVTRFPLLFELPPKLQNIKVSLMPSFDLSHDNRKMLKELFNFNIDDSIKERIIVFDVFRVLYKKTSYDLGKMDDCICEIIREFPYDEIICKPHPRSRSVFNFQMKTYKGTGIPMEVIYSDMNDLDNRILIGNHTTALYTPKMMFNKEPFVISLHNIVWSNRPNIPHVFEKIRSMYTNKGKIIAPKTLEDLKICLSNIKNSKL